MEDVQRTKYEFGEVLRAMRHYGEERRWDCLVRLLHEFVEGCGGVEALPPEIRARLYGAEGS